MNIQSKKKLNVKTWFFLSAALGLIIPTVSSFGATITTTTNINGYPFCVETNAYNLTVEFTTTGSFTTDVFKVQLCQPSGTWNSSPQIIGTANITISGSGPYTISCVIPVQQISSQSYMVRVCNYNSAGTSVLVTGSNSNTFTVVRNPTTPNIFNTFNNTTNQTIIGLCGQATYTFENTTPVWDADPNGYIWSLSNTTHAVFSPPSTTSAASITFNSSFNTYTNTITLTLTATNCNGTQQKTRSIAIRSVPTQPGTISGPTTSLCTNTQYAYSIAAIPPGSTDLTWSSSSGNVLVSDVAGVPGTSSSIVTTSLTAYFTFTATGSKILSVAGNTACGSGVARTLTISNGNLSASPASSVTPVGPLSFCQGGSSLLTVGAVSNSSYQWRLNGVDIGGATAQTYTANATGNYTCVVTKNTTGCSTTSNIVSVTVNSNPVVSINAVPPVICNGGTTELTATPSGTYVWSTSETINPITISSAGNYSVIVTDNNNCSGTGSLTVGNSTFSVTISANPASTCVGQSSTISANLSGGVSPFTYLWNGSDPTAPPLTVTPNQTTAYTLMVTDANNCTAVSNTETVTVNQLPVPVITPSGSLCNGGFVTLTSDPYAAYVWSDFTTGQSYGSNITSAGTFSVTVTDANGCTGSSSIVVQAGSLAVNITPPNPSFCAGGNVILTANSAGATTYVWSTTDVTSSITVVASGTYDVIVTDGGTCSGTASTSVTVNPVPMVSITCAPLIVCPTCTAQLDATVTNSTATPFVYQWTPGTQLSSTAIEDPVINGPLSSAITYTLLVTDANLCTGTANSPLISPLQIYVDATNVNSTLYDVTAPGVNLIGQASGSVIAFAPSTGVPEAHLDIQPGDGIKPVQIKFNYDPNTLDINQASVFIDDLSGNGFFPLNADFFEVPSTELNKIIFYKDKKVKSPLNIQTNLISGMVCDKSIVSNQFAVSIDPLYYPVSFNATATVLLIKYVPTGTIVKNDAFLIWDVTTAALGLYEFELTLEGTTGLANTVSSKQYKGQFILRD